MTAELAGLKAELGRLNAALDASEAKSKDQQAQIVDLGQKLNRALASKVEELARYRSEFFGKLREALAGQRDVQIVGDRFVFQSEVLFPSGSAQLQPAGEKQLAEVAQRLIEIAARIPKDINWVLQVDGHTDDKPIRNVRLPVELGTVGGARHRRREVPAQPGHPQRAPGGGGLRRIPAALRHRQRPQPRASSSS